jgi:hypothetical protein
VTEKLTRSNFPLWRAQLSEFLDDDVVAPAATLIADDKKTKVPNPEFVVFVAKQ